MIAWRSCWHKWDLRPFERIGAYTLSGGERRRLEIARSLVLEPAFLLLDEPFSGIDPLTVVDIQKIIASLSRLGIGVLITDHNVPETLAVADRAYILHSGTCFVCRYARANSVPIPKSAVSILATISG